MIFWLAIGWSEFWSL